MIRQDDMLVRWGDNKFLLVFMVDKEHNAKQVLDKFNSIILNKPIVDYGCKLNLNIQNKDEKITTFIKKSKPLCS